jgi:hypothetical protein
MKIRLHGRRTAEPGRAQEARTAREPAAVTWARAQLREQIQRTGATPGAGHPARGQADARTDRSPLADREAEP